MTPENWANVRALVESAMLLPTEERLTYINAANEDQPIRDEAAQLLGFEHQASAIFPIEGWKQGAQNIAAEATLAGKMLGNYRLIAEIGRGGMGAVYLAERADGEYQQKVALKVLQEGIFTPALVERFSQERQILARLSHPGITRLLDGGVTPDGRPYFVLEYVDGLPIDQYCAKHQLDTTAKLKLFLKVAEAVQSAHQQLVLHLDLKPANILVTPEGEPRLLDFGISRLLSEGEGGTRQVEATLRLLTPRYASPEQAQGLPLGVASDVFSLATLLYKLLTSHLPYAIDDTSPLEAARIISEVTPKPPSESASATIAPELRGDLDIILLQGLRKEPERRYATVAAFAEDLRRHLASEPVLAHADSFTYRAGKFLRRNRIAVAAATVVLIILTGSFIAVERSAIAARRARVKAEAAETTAERRLKDSQALAHSYMFDLLPALEDIPGTLKVRADVMNGALTYLKAMSAENSTDKVFEHELASAWFLISQLQGNSSRRNLGDRAASMDTLNRNIEIQRRLAAQNPGDEIESGRLMVSIRAKGRMYLNSGDLSTASKLFAESWAIGKPVLDAGPKNTRYLDLASLAWSTAMVDNDAAYWNRALPTEALQWATTGQSLMERFAATKPAITKDPRYISQISNIKATKADALVTLGRSDEAEKIYREMLPTLDAASLGNVGIAVDIMRLTHERYAVFLLDQGRLAEATKIAAILRPGVSSQFGETTGQNLFDLMAEAEYTGFTANLDFRNNRLAEARAGMRSTLAGYRKAVADAPDLITARFALAGFLLDFSGIQQVNPTEARAMANESIALVTAHLKDHPEATSAHLDLAHLHLNLKRLAKSPTEAQQHHEAARTELKTALAASPNLPVAQTLLASLTNPSTPPHQN